MCINVFLADSRINFGGFRIPRFISIFLFELQYFWPEASRAHGDPLIEPILPTTEEILNVLEAQTTEE